MKKTFFISLLWSISCVCCILAVTFCGTASASMIDSETPVMNPPSTANMWAYYYDSDASSYISGHDYVREGDLSDHDPRTQDKFKGYVTGSYGPWNVHRDSWSRNNHGDYNTTVHAFETYIISSVDKKIYFDMGGDDGFSIFINDEFLGGGTYWDSSVSTSHFTLQANTQYKLTYFGSNDVSWQFGWWFRMYEADSDWYGRISENPDITMNANPVPIPGAIWILGSGLLGLVAVRERRQDR